MEGYVNQVRGALEARDFKKVADLLWIPVLKNPPSPTAQAVKELFLSIQSINNNSENSFIPVSGNVVPLAEVINEHVQLVHALSTNNPSLAWNHAFSALSSLVKSLTPESRIEIPILKRLCSNLYYLALLSDETDKREESARLLSRVFTICITDRAALSNSKKWASIGMANLLFRLYFRLGTIRLCNNIVRAIDTTTSATDFPSITAFPKAEQIVYSYYRARLAINLNEFRKAEEWLTHAVKICPFQSQKRELMIYLILVKMIHGHLPLTPLLSRHNLINEFHHLSQALCTGDLRLFDQVLTVNQSFYISREIFLVIQLQLRNLILRSFFKKLYIIQWEESRLIL
jgi:hypothetical protein